MSLETRKEELKQKYNLNDDELKQYLRTYMSNVTLEGINMTIENYIEIGINVKEENERTRTED